MNPEETAIELGAPKARAERFPSYAELLAERFGGPIALTTVCYRCGGLLTTNIAGFAVHAEPHTCDVPTVLIVEVAVTR